jgi:hypothetical protein
MYLYNHNTIILETGLEFRLNCVPDVGDTVGDSVANVKEAGARRKSNNIIAYGTMMP